MELFAFLVIISTLGLLGRMKKHTPPKITQQQEQADEVITVILPIVNDKK